MNHFLEPAGKQPLNHFLSAVETDQDRLNNPHEACTILRPSAMDTPHNTPSGGDHVLYPGEFDTQRLRLGSKRSFGGRADDWSMDLFYDDLPLQIQTPWMTNVFGLSKYDQPHSGRTAYSMSFELSKDSEVADFHRFLADFEGWFQTQLKEMGIVLPFFSSIRQPKNPQYNPTLRVKLKTKFENFDVAVWENRLRVKWPIGEERVRHGEKARLILQLMPIWCAGGRVGTSWKLTGLQKQAHSNFRQAEPGFRKESFVPEPVFRE